MSIRKHLFNLFLIICWVFSGPVIAEFSIADYGSLPAYRSLTLSPDAKHYAYLTSIEGEDALVVVNTASGKTIFGTRLDGLKARDAYFIDQKNIVFIASITDNVTLK